MSDTVQPRRVVPSLTINGYNAISGPFAAHLLSFTYTDNLNGKLDGLDLSIEDVQHHWIDRWAPDEGARIAASLDLLQAGYGWSTLDCGEFEVQGISLQGPPSVVGIQATSATVSASLRRTERSHAWENVKLSDVVRDIARRNGVEYVYADGIDPVFDRLTQQRSTDLSYLTKLAGEAGLYVRMTNGTIWVGGREALIASARTVVLDVEEVSSYRFEAMGYKRYRACEVNYQRPESRTVVTATATAPPRTLAGTAGVRRPRRPRPRTVLTATAQTPGATLGEVLRVNRRADNMAEAQRLAAAYLEEANRQSVRAEITMPGRTEFVAGVVMDLQGFGVFTGPRLVESSVHSFTRSGGYTTRLGFLASELAVEGGEGEE